MVEFPSEYLRAVVVFSIEYAHEAEAGGTVEMTWVE
jgi:hypothetical protein